MTDLQEARMLRDDLEAVIYPRRGRRITDHNSISRIFSAVANVMEQYKTEVCVKDRHVIWFRYHAANPTAVILPGDLVCRAALDAADRAMNINLARAQARAVAARSY